MRIVALPRSSNPFQRLLYEEIEREGHGIRYAGELTRSHTLNLLLLPFELIAYRAAGWRILHIHWVYMFSLPGAARHPFLRKVSRAWFSIVLFACRLTRIRIVWSAHNVLPHGRVFDDEVAARRSLVNASEVVLLHAPGALDALQRIGARPRRTAYVRLGPLAPGLDATALRAPGTPGPPLRLLFFGQVLEHKGVEDLLAAIAEIPTGVAIEVVVAGECRNPQLRDRLRGLAARAGERVELQLELIPDDEVSGLFSSCDLVVLPFRRVTTSSSTLLAMGHGRGLVLPRLPAFDDLPSDAIAFYDGSVAGLRDAIVDAAQWGPEQLQQMGAAAAAHVSALSWAVTARQTLAAIGT